MYEIIYTAARDQSRQKFHTFVSGRDEETAIENFINCKTADHSDCDVLAIVTEHAENDFSVYFVGADYSLRGTRIDVLKEIRKH